MLNMLPLILWGGEQIITTIKTQLDENLQNSTMKHFLIAWTDLCANVMRLHVITKFLNVVMYSLCKWPLNSLEIFSPSFCVMWNHHIHVYVMYAVLGGFFFVRLMNCLQSAKPMHQARVEDEQTRKKGSKQGGPEVNNGQRLYKLYSQRR